MKPTAAPVPISPNSQGKAKRDHYLRFRCAVSGCPKCVVLPKEQQQKEIVFKPHRKVRAKGIAGMISEAFR